MRVVCVGLIVVAAAAGQDKSVYQTTSIDINGNRVSNGLETLTKRSPNESETTEKMQSVNGRMVPLERIEERVLRDDAAGKLIERVIRRFDQTGNPALPEKVVIDEHRSPNGSSTVLTTRYAGDINGSMRVVERSQTLKQVSGGTETSDTIVEQPTLNGSFETVQKTNTVKTKQAGGFEEASITYRKDPSGSLYPAARRVTDHTESGNRATDNIAEYEVGPTGQLELHSQRIVTADKHSNGAEDVQVDIFDKNVPGVVNDTRALQLKEHQIIARRPANGGAMVETLSVQRPTVSDPTRLGPPRQISETLCRGACKP